MSRPASRTSSLLPLLAIAAVGCASDEVGPTEEQLLARDIAARQACIAERLALRAQDELRTLEGLMVVSGPIEFQRAYAHHASLRHAAYAQVDSAFNHSPTPRDSVRHAEAASGFQIRAPSAESVEANVIRSFESNLAAIYNDSDHPCNWQAQLERRE